MKRKWDSFRSGDCTDMFSTKAITVLIPRSRRTKHEKPDKQDERVPCPLEEDLRVTEMTCLSRKNRHLKIPKPKKHKFKILKTKLTMPKSPKVSKHPEPKYPQSKILIARQRKS